MSPCARLFAGLLLLWVALPAQGQDKVSADAYARVNAALVENHVVPRYRRLAVATAALAEAAGDYCGGQNPTALDTLRDRYHDAMDAWMGVQHLRFGPVELFMRAHRLYFWPEAMGRIGEAVDAALTTAQGDAVRPEALESASAAVQGLPAVEHLLYDDGQFPATGPGDGPRCALLAAITGNMCDMAAGIVGEWQGGRVHFARTVTQTGGDNRYYDTPADATLAFFKSLHGGLQLLADIKLKPVIGASAAKARPQNAESTLSGRAMRNIVVNLEALEALYLGEGGPGLSDIVSAHGGDTDLDPLMRKAFGITGETARSIDRPLAQAVRDPAARPQTEKLLTQVIALKQIVKTRVAEALDLAVGFNAMDGD